MKKLLLTILILSLTLILFTGYGAAVDDSYWDIITEHESLQDAKDIFTDPYAGLTRAEFTHVMANLAQAELHMYIRPWFEDVNVYDEYFAAITWAGVWGISQGDDWGDFAPIFSPHRHITRQEGATMLYRYINIYGINLNPAEKDIFADEGTIAYWAVDAVLALQEAGILQSTDYPDGQFNPNAVLTAGEAATMFARFILLTE